MVMYKSTDHEPSSFCNFSMNSVPSCCIDLFHLFNAKGTCPERMVMLALILFVCNQQSCKIIGVLVLQCCVDNTVDKRCSAVLRGVSHEGRLIGGGARNQKPDGDTRRRDNDLDRFGPSDRRNTLRPVSLVYCIDHMP